MIPPPVLSPLKNGLWLVRKPYFIRAMCIEKGFITDLDSIPRLPLVHACLKGRTVIGALAHDYLLSLGIPRAICRRELWFCMRLEGVALKYRVPIITGVWLGDQFLALKKIFSKSACTPQPADLSSGRDRPPPPIKRQGG
jgi:hypothetical protein